MSWTIGTPVRVGTAVFAAVSKTKIAARGTNGHIGVWGAKQAVLILECKHGGIRGVDLAGAAHSEAEIEALYPEALKELKARLRSLT